MTISIRSTVQLKSIVNDSKTWSIARFSPTHRTHFSVAQNNCRVEFSKSDRRWFCSRCAYTMIVETFFPQTLAQSGQRNNCFPLGLVMCVTCKRCRHLNFELWILDNWQPAVLDVITLWITVWYSLITLLSFSSHTLHALFMKRVDYFLFFLAVNFFTWEIDFSWAQHINGKNKTNSTDNHLRTDEKKDEKGKEKTVQSKNCAPISTVHSTFWGIDWKSTLFYLLPVSFFSRLNYFFIK